MSLSEVYFSAFGINVVKEWLDGEDVTNGALGVNKLGLFNALLILPVSFDNFDLRLFYDILVVHLEYLELNSICIEGYSKHKEALVPNHWLLSLLISIWMEWIE